MSLETDFAIIDVYRLDGEEISVDFSDGTATTFSIRELLEFRAQRLKASGTDSQ